MKKHAAMLLSLLLAALFLLFLVLSLPPSSGGSGICPERAWEPEDLRVDLNRAGAEELQQIAGIGPVLSEAIVKWREENGPFRSAEDLLRVPGIGEKTVEAMKDYVSTGGADEDPGGG